MRKLRRRERSAKRGARPVGVGAPDWTLTGMAGLAAVDELIGRLGIVEVLGRGIGPIKQRDRGLSGGQLLVGMATAQLVGQDCPDGMDRVRADVGNALLVEAPVAPSRTAARLGPVRAGAADWDRDRPVGALHPLAAGGPGAGPGAFGAA